MPIYALLLPVFVKGEMVGCVPFFSGRDTTHAMQSVKDGLQTCQDRAIKPNREGAFQTWLVSSLGEQALQLNLKVKPVQKKRENKAMIGSKNFT